MLYKYFIIFFSMLILSLSCNNEFAFSGKLQHMYYEKHHYGDNLNVGILPKGMRHIQINTVGVIEFVLVDRYRHIDVWAKDFSYYNYNTYKWVPIELEFVNFEIQPYFIMVNSDTTWTMRIY